MPVDQLWFSQSSVGLRGQVAESGDPSRLVHGANYQHTRSDVRSCFDIAITYKHLKFYAILPVYQKAFKPRRVECSNQQNTNSSNSITGLLFLFDLFCNQFSDAS